MDGTQLDFHSHGVAMMKGLDPRWQTSARDPSESDSMVGASRGHW